MLTRNRLLLLLLAVAAGFTWNMVAAQEVATLHVLAGAGTEDHYAQVWVVDDRPYVWIRAETPTRRWLEPLRAAPDIYLWRNGVRHSYRAHIWTDTESDARPYVDGLFRKKYGYVDRFRALLRKMPTIPIRLDPRAES